ncbi:CDGSH iron-sulfur domain-containing protein [Haloprofundus halobius]|uniref:CDGSH iron-sulfur domain-containing protein n=1 Tax=Haloprofundus halobius TaxID=2876194 RepID=UPI001CCD9558|nr:CDGSH iron-sulfur domain-containing protein [Haloprofundus halobius]
MKEEIHNYTGEGIEVSYDVRRCIHARECVRGLPAVFDPDRRPWIDPNNADADDIAEVIERCPTGALHYERTDDGPEEAVPDENTVTVTSDGPHYVRGDGVIETPGGGELLADTRMALCRCGASENKPLCDNSHLEIEFEALGTVGDEHADDVGPGTTDRGGPLTVVPTPDGPLHVTGLFEMHGEDDASVFRGTDAWLCRCGHSGAKPFCDGTHARVGFSTEGE